MVASTPSSRKFSGWPAQGLPSWRKSLDVLDRRPRVAGEVEQRIDQHRAVAGRQHEAVAVGPVRIGRIVASDIRSTAPWRRRPCPSACRDGRYWRPGPHPSTRRGWRWRAVSIRRACMAPLAEIRRRKARGAAGSFIGGRRLRQLRSDLKTCRALASMLSSIHGRPTRPRRHRSGSNRPWRGSKPRPPALPPSRRRAEPSERTCAAARGP